MDIAILCLTDDLVRGSGLGNADKKVLYANIGRYVAAESTERGWVFLVKTLADSKAAARKKWEKQNPM